MAPGPGSSRHNRDTRTRCVLVRVLALVVVGTLAAVTGLVSASAQSVQPIAGHSAWSREVCDVLGKIAAGGEDDQNGPGDGYPNKYVGSCPS
jgi:hypothetical protein